MFSKKKKYYITTSIAYTNAVPHIGYALELIQADVIARFHRQLGEPVFFLTGTDEHGQKIVKAAQELGKETIDFTDQISAKFQELTKVLNLTNNDFIRTSDQKRHWPAVNMVWQKLKEKGKIYKKKYRGLYCLGCEAFIKEKDLVKGLCPVHKRRPELIEEENYFFKLSNYTQAVENLIKEEKIKIIPETRKNEMLSFVKQGLEDLSFSRPREKLKWGIPVPDDPSQTIYVWADALTNYISAIGYADDEKKFKGLWPADVHVIGKDIQKFHCIIWPAMLLALELELPKIVFVHGFITVKGQKMSKSLKNIVDPFALVKKYGAEVVRYFLLREIPASEDGDFSYQKLEQRYNADLAKGLGNLVSRVVALAEKNKADYSLKDSIKDPGLKRELRGCSEEWENSLMSFNFNQALISIWKLISACDRYIEQQKPWVVNARQKATINNLLIVLNAIAGFLVPLLPETSEKMLLQLKNKETYPLFPKI